jgi:hypothetical protein
LTRTPILFPLLLLLFILLTPFALSIHSDLILMRSFDWNKILTLNKEYLSDKQVVEQAHERGEEVPDWDKVAQTTVWERWAYYLY